MHEVDERDAVATRARARLDAALTEMATVPGTDEAWARLRGEVGRTVDELIAAGWLPPHLAVRPAEPPVVVARTAARAFARLSGRPSSAPAAWSST